MRRSMLIFALITSLGLIMLSACARTTMTAQRKQQISDCLARCQAMNPPGGAVHVREPATDTRSGCEQSCHNAY